MKDNEDLQMLCLKYSKSAKPTLHFGILKKSLDNVGVTNLYIGPLLYILYKVPDAL